jgi:hypothetical protein
MSERLDHLVERLAVSPTDRSLENFDADVSRGVSRWRAQAQTAGALAPVRVASISLALAMGVAVGGVTAAASIAVPRTSAVLSGANLAPSTLLEGGQ